MLVQGMHTELFQQYILAGNPQTPATVLRELAFHDNHKVRARVAENPAAAPKTLRALASDPHPDVRVAVASNPATPQDIVFALSKDPDPTVRYGLAEDMNTSPEVLSRLAEDDNGYVAWRARKTLELLHARQGVPVLAEQRLFRRAKEADSIHDNPLAVDSIA